MPFRTFTIHNMTPIWVFPAYPLLLIGPFAANLIDALPNAAAAARINSLAITFGAVTIQGTGFLLSLMIYAAFIYRLMTQKLPREVTRPGMVRNFASNCTKQCLLDLVRISGTQWVHSRWHSTSGQHSNDEDHA